jgi:hypothetical protein
MMTNMYIRMVLRKKKLKKMVGNIRIDTVLNAMRKNLNLRKNLLKKRPTNFLMFMKE